MGRGNGQTWSDADLEALYELAPTCTYPQIAEYMGRTVKAVERKIFKLRRAGQWDRPMTGPGTHGGRRSPFIVPGNAILIAKTCPQCGFLRDASRYRVRIRPSGIEWRERCNRCQNKQNRGNPSNKEQLIRQRRLDTGVQAVTIETADHRGEVYTQADLEIASDMKRSDFEVAITLGRTLYAIRGLRTRLKVKTQQWQGDSHWLIHFPNAMRALQEHYRALGVVPEGEWDWNDQEAC